MFATSITDYNMKFTNCPDPFRCLLSRPLRGLSGMLPRLGAGHTFLYNHDRKTMPSGA